ncbi:hypothetical protein JCM17960_29280 [Magnetospira thiophila]
MEPPLTLEQERQAHHQMALRREQLINLLDTCVFETDAHFRLVAVSDPSVRHMGYYPVELVGCLLDDIIRPVLPRADATREQKRQPFRDLLYQYESRDDLPGLLKVSAAPLYDTQDGRFLGMIGMLEDATNTPLAWQGLKKLVQALDNDFVPLLMSDEQGKILYANPRFQEISGHGEMELKSLTRADLLFQDSDDTETTRADEQLTAFGAWQNKSFYRTRRSELYEVEEIAFRISSPLRGTPLDLWMLFDEQARRMAVALPAASAQAGIDKILGHATRLLRMVALLNALIPGYPVTRGTLALDRGPTLAASPSTEKTSNEQVQALPRRQREVLSLMMKGYSNKQIARQLEISEATVKSHVRAVCDRLGAENRTQAVVLASNLGTVTL